MSPANSASGAATGRPHFQDELRELEQRALGAIDIVLEQLDRAVPERRYIHTHPSFGYRFQSEARLSHDRGSGEPRAAQTGERPGGRQPTPGRVVQ